MIRQGHQDATGERIAKCSLVLAIQDTTELNYTRHKALSGAGYLDNKYAKELKIHSVLTLSSQGITLGIIEQQVWSRKEDELGKAQQRKKKETAQKESQRWLEALKKLIRFLGRKDDGSPGVKVLWHGLSRLHDLVQGWLVGQPLVVN